MAGHSKWANIKHKKAKNDARRGKLWSKCARAIIVAAKSGGGNPEMNLSLRYAIDDAKAANMPKDTIENAIKKGSGELGGESYESLVYEGYGPCGVAIMLDILTDNRNRTAGEIRKILDKANGNLGATGCVGYMFASKGEIFVSKEGVTEEQLMEVALEAGADDIADADEAWQVLCEPTAFLTVRKAIEEAGMTVEQASITMIPDNTVAITGDDVQKVMNMVETLEDNDDVQKVHANFEISDEDMAALDA